MTLTLDTHLDPSEVNAQIVIVAPDDDDDDDIDDADGEEGDGEDDEDEDEEDPSDRPGWSD